MITKKQIAPFVRVVRRSYGITTCRRVMLKVGVQEFQVGITYTDTEDSEREAYWYKDQLITALTNMTNLCRKKPSRKKTRTRSCK